MADVTGTAGKADLDTPHGEPAPEPTVWMSPTIGQFVAALCDVIKAVPAIEKTKRPGAGITYPYRSIDDILPHVKALFPAHGFVVLPAGVRVAERMSYPREKGGYATNVLLAYRFRILHKSGEWALTEVAGEGADVGDKSTNKALTAAFKYLLNPMLLIADADPDETPSVEMARGAPAARPNRPAGAAGGTAGGTAAPAKPAPSVAERFAKYQKAIPAAQAIEDVQYLIAGAKKAKVFSADQLAELERLAKVRSEVIFSGSDDGPGDQPPPDDDGAVTEVQF